MKNDYLEDEGRGNEGIDQESAIQLACIEIKRMFKVRFPVTKDFHVLQ